jgi:hypothetical protein
MIATVVEPRALLRWALYLFIFSIPLEYPPRNIPLEVHTVTGALFLLVTLSQPGACYRWPAAAIWFFGGYLWIFAGLGVFSQHTGTVAKLFANYLEVFFIFWVASNLLRHPRVARGALIAYVAAGTLVALIQVIEPEAMTAEHAAIARRTVLGQDPNVLGGNLALALAALVGLMAAGLPPSARLASMGAVLLLAAGLAGTGSRGAVAAAAAGLVASIAGMRRRPSHAIVVLLVGAVVAGSAMTSAAFRYRTQETLTSGRMSGREMIYPTAWQMFGEKPLLGWGPIDNMYELGWRTAMFPSGERVVEGVPPRPDRDTHNMFLETLTATGLAGTAAFTLCLLLCLAAAWRGRTGSQGGTPLALAVIIVGLNLSVNWTASKAMWLCLGYAIASARMYQPAAISEGPADRGTRGSPP